MKKIASPEVVCLQHKAEISRERTAPPSPLLISGRHLRNALLQCVLLACFLSLWEFDLCSINILEARQNLLMQLMFEGLPLNTV